VADTRIVDVGAVVDAAALRPISILVLVLCLLIAMCDGFDNQALAFTAPAIARDLGLKMPDFAPVFSAGLFGLLLGSMLFGTLADHFGRRRLLLVCAAVFGAATLATPYVHSTVELMVVRFIGGLGIGGVPSAAAALVGETVPRRHRQSFIAWTLVGVPLGGFFGGFVGAYCIPNFGWQSVYWIGGGVTALVLAASAIWLPESNRYLALHAQAGTQASGRLAKLMQRIDPAGRYRGSNRFVLPPEEDRRSSVVALFAGGRTRMTVLYWLGSFVTLLIFYFVVNWTPTLFRESGLSANAATLSTSAVNAGAILTGLVLGTYCNRVGTRNAAASMFLIAASGLLLMSMFDGSIVPMMVGAFLAGAGAIAGASSMVMFGAESYPTALRSTGIGWSLSAGRIGSVISPWVVSVPLSLGWHAESILLLPIVPAIIGCACILLSRGARPPVAVDAMPVLS